MVRTEKPGIRNIHQRTTAEILFGLDTSSRGMHCPSKGSNAKCYAIFYCCNQRTPNDHIPHLIHYLVVHYTLQHNIIMLRHVACAFQPLHHHFLPQPKFLFLWLKLYTTTTSLAIQLPQIKFNFVTYLSLILSLLMKFTLNLNLQKVL